MIVIKSTWIISTDDRLLPSIMAETAHLDAEVKRRLGDTVSNKDAEAEVSEHFPAAPDEFFDEKETVDLM